MPSVLPDGDAASTSSHSDVEQGEEEQDVEENEYSDINSEDEAEQDSEYPTIAWTGYGKRTPILVFKADAIVNKNAAYRTIGEKYHLAYKMVKTECKLIRSVLSAHGFHEAHPNSNDFNLMWTGSHLKPYTLRSLQEFQKVNHFPRSYEITRKDRLFKNVQRMQQIKGFKHFDFIPQSFIIPGEFQDFCSAYLKDKGPWIVKPIASSRGRGIFLVNHPEQVPLDETMIVSKYVTNPLLIDGFKFDVRFYVAVTSYDPLIFYMYEEGLTRFATVKFDKSTKNIRNQCMHLTNYSVNKKSNDYVKNDDPDVEDFGNKWSLGALLRYLRSHGRDSTALMLRIEDVIIKTLISAELPIATACKMFMPFRGNCFELYGFDILVDDNLRPWILEVNLSPSLACDAPLDLKIKSNMIADLFSLTGFMCQDPMTRKISQSKRNLELAGRNPARAQEVDYYNSSYSRNRHAPFSGKERRWTPREGQGRQRPQSAGSVNAKGKTASSMSGLTGEEIRILRRAKEEYSRRGGWMRIFPNPDSWELYGSYLQFTTNNNWLLYQHIFPERAKNIPVKPVSANHSSGVVRSRSIHLHSAQYPQLHVSTEIEQSMASALQRSVQYERKLSCLGERRRRKKSRAKQLRKTKDTSATNGVKKEKLAQGIEVDTTKPQIVEVRESASQKPPPVAESGKGETPPVVRKAEAAKPPPQAKEVQEVKEPPPPPPKPKQELPPPPPPQPVVPKYNVVEQLEKGKTLSKVQARFAFATYLTRVQQRLMAETGSNSDPEDVEAANEQMDLVLRFLKRAAGNLQQAFKVVVPSRKLPLNDRRRILAKQLGDFIHIYDRETDQLRQRNKLEKTHLRKLPNFSRNEGLDETRFHRFVQAANESELEEVLTTYTRLNKSASIFLGSNSKSTFEVKPSNGLGSAPVHSQSDPALVRRREPATHEDPKTINQSTAATKERREAPPGGSSAPNIPHMSYSSAVSIYSAKVAPLLNKTRPMSASLHQNKAQVSSRMRPMSASMARPLTMSNSGRPATSAARERPDGSDSIQEHYDEEAINSALQRLAARQQHRQYSAHKGTSVLSAQGSSEGQPGIRTSNRSQSWSGISPSPDSHKEHKPNVQTNVTNYSGNSNECRDDSKENRPSDAREINFNSPDRHSGSQDGLHKSQSHAPTGVRTSKPGRSANETFNSFIEDSTPYYRNESVAAYSQVTGVNPMNGNYVPSAGSTQYQLAQQQQLKQQRIMEQSKALLEQSKAKHQAMVAQAHAAHKSRQGPAHDAMEAEADPESAMQRYAPKPPPIPASDKKPSSAHHRLARSASQESSIQRKDFYASLKYDNSTGTSRPSYSMGYGF